MDRDQWTRLVIISASAVLLALLTVAILPPVQQVVADYPTAMITVLKAQGDSYRGTTTGNYHYLTTSFSARIDETGAQPQDSIRVDVSLSHNYSPNHGHIFDDPWISYTAGATEHFHVMESPDLQINNPSGDFYVVRFEMFYVESGVGETLIETEDAAIQILTQPDYPMP